MPSVFKIQKRHGERANLYLAYCLTTTIKLVEINMRNAVWGHDTNTGLHRNSVRNTFMLLIINMATVQNTVKLCRIAAEYMSSIMHRNCLLWCIIAYTNNICREEALYDTIHEKGSDSRSKQERYLPRENAFTLGRDSSISATQKLWSRIS